MKKSSHPISFLFLSLAPAGGWCTNAAMFVRGVNRMGGNARLYRLGKRTWDDDRDFGMGASYRLISEEDMGRLPEPVILCAVDPHHHDVALRLLRQRPNFSVIVHDPNELKNEAYSREVRRHSVIVHRERMKFYFSKRDLFSPSTVVHHVPFCYIPENGSRPWEKRSGAVCLSRIDFDKNIETQLSANRELDEESKIRFYGFENRAYALRTLMPKFPEWVQSNGLAYKKTDDAAAFKKALSFRMVIDMSGGSGGDGGGAQYTFFESANAGCVLILNKQWTDVSPREMIPDWNCLAVSGPKELAQAISMVQQWPSTNNRLNRLQEGNQALLNAHLPEKVIPSLFKAVGL